MDENTIGVGDTVRVINNGNMYTTSEKWAVSINLENYTSYKNVDNGTVAVVTWTGKVPGQKVNAVSLSYEGKDYLIGVKGIELVKKVVEELPVIDEGDDLIGKHILSSKKLTFKIGGYNSIRDTLFMQCVDKSGISAKNVTPKKVRENLRDKVWKFVDNADDMIGKVFVTASSNRIKRTIESVDGGVYKMVPLEEVNNTIYRKKDQIMNTERFIEVVETPSTQEFKIGDKVEITDKGKQFPGLSNWAKDQGIENFVFNRVAENGTTGVITHMAQQYGSSSSMVCGVLIKDNTIVIKPEGLSIDKSTAKVEVGVDSLLQQWAKAFDSVSQLKREFFELWEGRSVILSSGIYEVVKKSENITRCARLYRKIKRTSDTPLASMNAQLILHYEKTLLENGLNMTIGHGKTEPLVSVVSNYRKKLEKVMSSPEPENYKGRSVSTGKYFATVIKQESETIHVEWDNGVGCKVWKIKEFEGRFSSGEWSWVDIPVKENKFVRQPWVNSKEVRDHITSLGYSPSYCSKMENYIWTYENGKFITTNTVPNEKHTVKVLVNGVESARETLDANIPNTSPPHTEQTTTSKLTREQLLGIIVKDVKGYVRKFQPGYNEKVLRAVELSNPTNVLVLSMGIINHLIAEGDWVILEGSKPVESDQELPTKVHDGLMFETQVRTTYIIRILDDTFCTVNDIAGGKTGTWKIENAQEMFDKGSWKEVKATITGDVLLNGVTTVEFKTNHFKQITRISENEQWQHYEATRNDYTTKPEEESKMQNEINLSVLVSKTAAFTTVPAFNVIYGQKVSNMSEADLFGALKSIEDESTVLKELGTGKSSKRVTNQIAKLKEAKEQVILAIDALPVDGEDE